MKPKILITGGCGKIGSYFAKFAAAQYAIRIVDKVAWDTRKHGPLPGESRLADLQDLAACREACEGMDMVVHLAADADPHADFMGSLLANNILASYNMFRAAKDAGCKRFIYASSVQVASGYPADIQFKRDMSVRPKNLYGVSKCYGEALAAYFAYTEGLPTIVLRIGAYTSPEKYGRFSLAEIPVPCLVRYILVKYARSNADALLAMGPLVFQQMEGLIAAAEAEDSDRARLEANDGLSQIVSWLRAGMGE